VLARVRPLPGRGAAVVELVTRTSRPFAAGDVPGSSVFGPFDRIADRVDEAGLTFLAARGVASQHEWCTLDGETLRLSCTVDWPGAPAAATAPLLCSPLLAAPVTGFRSSRAWEAEDPIDCIDARGLVAQALAATGAGQDDRTQLVDLDIDQDVDVGGGGAVLLAPGAAGAQVAARVVQRLADAFAPVRCAIEVFAVEAGAAVTGPPVWRAAGPLLANLPGCFASARERTFLADWDVEVAQAARLASPRLGLCEDGWFATATVLPQGVHGPRRLELALERIHFVELRQRELVLSTEALGVTQEGTIRLPAERVVVERPVTRALRIDTMIELDENGTAELRRQAAGLLGPGRELVVRVRVE
jgi:hypothetical protein